MMNWKGFGKKRCGLILRCYPIIGWRDWGKPRNPSVGIAGPRSEIWTRIFPIWNRSVNHDVWWLLCWIASLSYMQWSADRCILPWTIHTQIAIYFIILQCSKWAGICRYNTISYRHLPIYIYLSFSTFLTVYPCFDFKRNTGTSKFPFRALVYYMTYLIFLYILLLVTNKISIILIIQWRSFNKNSKISKTVKYTILSWKMYSCMKMSYVKSRNM
jgi:hypothetical protein